MAKPSRATCALWYDVGEVIKIGLFETAIDAADFAVMLQREESGLPIGVQHSDGSVARLADWPDYFDAIERADQIEAPSPPTKMVLSPFDSAPVSVDRHTPAWVGDHRSSLFPVTPLLLRGTD